MSTLLISTIPATTRKRQGEGLYIPASGPRRHATSPAPGRDMSLEFLIFNAAPQTFLRPAQNQVGLAEANGHCRRKHRGRNGFEQSEG
jgi:hypothetical protein